VYEIRCAVIGAVEVQTMPELWERRDDETNQAWNAFCLYRDYGADRGFMKAIDSNGIPASRYGVWCKWSAKFDWVKRCGSYDTHLDALRRAEREREFAERERIYRRITEKALAIVEKRLDGFDPEELSQANVMEWLKGSIDIERVAFGTGGKDEADGKKDFTGQLEINFVSEFEGL